MPELQKSAIERIIRDAFDGTSLKETTFCLGHNVPPLHIIGLSKLFPELNISKEDILLLSYEKKNVSQCDFILTDKHIYYHQKEEKKQLPIDQIFEINEKKQFNTIFKNIEKGLKEKLKTVFQKIEDKDIVSKQKDLKDFVDMINKKTGKSTAKTDEQSASWVINPKYLKTLKNEGDKYLDACNQLNNMLAFRQTLLQIIKSESSAIDYQAEHIFLNDLIKIYNQCEKAVDGQMPLKAQFTLAYMFERLQGNDMAESIPLDRINQMVEKENFIKNVDKVKEASFFNLGEAYKDEYLLPSILVRMEHFLFDTVGSHLYHFASLIIKADGKVNEKEKEALKNILNTVKSPKKTLDGVKRTDVPENETLEDVLKDLHELIGLEEIKKSIVELTNFLKIQKVRAEKGLATTDKSLHAVFMGPPGTGKTTIARILSRIYKHLGYLEKGHLVETDRAGLVAGYIGQTAIKVDEVVKAALGGVLFIDEAYSLAGDMSGKDFGNEAVEVLLKRMEDHRKDLVVITAGYPDEMELFIKSNPGLQSRFNRYFTFDHFRPEQLLAIFKMFCKKSDFKLAEDAQDKLMEIFDRLYEKKHPGFGNARVVRNLFEKIIEIQSNRIVNIAPLTEEILITLTEEDIPAINKTVKEILVFE